MKKWNSVWLLCLLTTVAYGQVKDFKFRQPIENIQTDAWYSIALPQQAFIASRPDFSDVRIYSIHEKDSLEIPYLLKVRADEIIDQSIELSMINKSTQNGKLFVTFELKNGQHVNYLDLGTDQSNFNGYVQIEGSADQKSWFVIDSLQRILAIQRDGIDFRATTLHFSETNYRFLRLTIDTDHPIRVVTATFKNRKIKKGAATIADLKFKSSSNRKTKQTSVDVALQNYQPVSSVSVSVSGDIDFYRPLVIESLTDSIHSEKGWIYNYGTLYSSYIISGTEMKFEFPYVLTSKLRLTILNNDNTPLDIKEIKVEGPQIDVVTKLKPGANFLYYGNEGIYAPNYDIVHFEDKIPASLASASIGAAENLSHPITKGSPLFESKVWIWAAMGLVIVLLGYFTLKMMKTKT